MNTKKSKTPTKQSDLSVWIGSQDTILSNEVKPLVQSNPKPRLSFGFGYDPKVIRDGITSFSLSHELGDNLKLYEFNPRLSYKIFSTLAKIMKYKYIGSELRKESTSIKNNYFITNRNPEELIKEINSAIDLIFKNYEIES